MAKEIIHAENAPASIGPYSQAVKAGQFLFVSGQIPIDPATGRVLTGSITQQAERVLKNIKAVLKGAGGTLKNVVKTTIFLTDMDDFSTVNEVYAKYFADEPPARVTVQVVRLPKNANIEIEAIAFFD